MVLLILGVLKASGRPRDPGDLFLRWKNPKPARMRLLTGSSGELEDEMELTSQL